MLEEVFIPHLHSHNELQDSWFMQDGARPHRTAEVFSVLNQHFGDRVIGLDYPGSSLEGLEWPPYSPDLNPCDYFLWGYLKDKVWQSNPKTISELKRAISGQVAEISTEICQKVIRGFEGRLTAVIAKDGGHFEHLYH